MRFLHCIASANPSGGGPIEGVKRLAAEMQRRGHAVEIATLDDPASPWLADHPGVVHGLGPSYLNFGYTPRLFPWLRANAKRFDIVIANGLWQYNSFAVWRALKGTTIPYLVFPHGMLDPWFKHTYPLKHAKKWLYWPWGQYRVLRDASAVVFTCEEERLLASKAFWLYRCKEAVVNYGTADPQPLRREDREEFLRVFPDLAGLRVLLFLGRIHRKKGCDNMIRAFARVAHTDEDLHLVIAGPDSTNLRPELDRLIESEGITGRVTWTGELRGALKWGAFQHAEAFVLFSHQENFGIAVAEALGCGVPVLISDKVNIWREIEADGGGLVASDTVAGGTELLRRWLTLDSRAREKLREHSRACFVERFEIGHMADSMLAITNQNVQASV